MEFVLDLTEAIQSLGGIFYFWSFFWVILSFVAWIIASNKGRNGFGYFLLSIVLSPIIGIVVVLLAPENQDILDKKNLRLGKAKKCSFCAEVIKNDAITCRYCGKDV